MESKRGVCAKVALITGANSGIGLALARRFVRQRPDICVCLGCRSQIKAEAARSALLKEVPTATVDIILIDIAKLASVYQAATEIKRRYDHLDYLYLNAGIMPGTTVDWKFFWKNLFTVNCVHMFATGDGLLRQTDGQTSDGLKEIFTTNLFGHFILVKELEPCIGGAYQQTQIIWTSSSNAKKTAFQMNDLQHADGIEPYSASKYATDLVSCAINSCLNNKGIYCHTTCPGLVMTNLTYGILPSWFWFLLLPILWILRVLTPSFTISPDNGCEALYWLSEQQPQTLDPLSKYHSQVSVIGRRYVRPRKMDINPELAADTYNKLAELEAKFKLTCQT